MSWERTHSGLLYKFECSEEGYHLSATDLKSVVEEKLNAKNIERRGEELGCPFALSAPQNVATFSETISYSSKDYADFDFDSHKAYIKAKSSGIEWQWMFDLQQLDSSRTIHVLGSLVEGYQDVIDKAADLVNSRNSIITRKNLVIQGLRESGRRGVDYKPPPFLSEYLDAEKFPDITGDELIASYWKEDVDSEATQ